MPARCAYCGREEDFEKNIQLHECPVCGAIACPVCLALIEFNEVEGQMDGYELARTWRAAVCKVHLPWNIIEGIKKNAKEEEND